MSTTRSRRPSPRWTTQPGFACVLTDGKRSVVVHSIDADLLAAASSPDDPAELAALDVTVLHRALVPHAWGLPDTVDAVGYAHDVDEAMAAAPGQRRHGGADAPHAGVRRRRGRPSRRADAAQVHAVHAEAGVGTCHAPFRRPAAGGDVAPALAAALTAATLAVRRPTRASALTSTS